MGSGQDVIVKVFHGRRSQQRKRRELRGLAAMASAGVAVPRLLRQGVGNGAAALALERIEAAAKASADDLPALLHVLATLHRAGVRQRDLHPGNFLIAKGRVFAVDGADARPARIGRRARLADVATLLAQFPAADARIDTAATQYAAAGGGGIDDAALRRQVAAARRRRAIALAAKTVRDCTPFAISRGADRLVATARGDQADGLPGILADPDAAMAGGLLLKRGNTATVARVGDLVVKRYNLKNPAQRLRWRLRSSRARRAWRVAHGLRLLGIATPAPRALIERPRAKVGSASAYLVTDHVPGQPLAELIGDELPTASLLAALRRLFQALRTARLGHGDMKASNFLLVGDDIHILDLDAAALCTSGVAFAHRHRRDLDRFARNWRLPWAAVGGADGRRAMTAADAAKTRRIVQLCPHDHPPFVAVCQGHAAALGSLGYEVETVFFETRGVGPRAADDARYAPPAQLVDIVGGMAVQALVSHRYRGYRAGLDLAHRLGIPTHIAIAHEFGLFNRPLRRLRRRLARRPTRFAAVSEPVAEELRASGINAPAVLPNPLDAAGLRATLRTRAEARALLGLAADAFAVGVVGRLHPKKAPMQALHAFQHAFDSTASDTGTPKARLVFVGDGELRAALEAAADARVVFAGFRSDATRLLRAFDVLLCCSTRHEAFGLALLEALAADVPVLCADRPGPRFVLGDCGYYFTDGDQLSAALAAARRDRISAPPGAARRIEREFSVAALAARYRELLPD